MKLEPVKFNRFLLPIALGLTTLALTLASAVQAESPTESPAVSQSIPQTSFKQLPSDRLIDYFPLQDLLRAGEWTAANAMTSNLMLRAARQHDRGFLVTQDIQNFPCKDLLTVNRLWNYYSWGRFGYSVQSDLWVRRKGKTYEDSVRFAKQVGWNRPVATIDAPPSASPSGPPELNPPELNPPELNPKQVPVGYLPFRPASNGGLPDAWGGGWIAAMPQRLNVCMNPKRSPLGTNP